MRPIKVKIRYFVHLLNIGPPKHALIAIVGNPILAIVTFATKSPRLLPFENDIN